MRDTILYRFAHASTSKILTEIEEIRWMYAIRKIKCIYFIFYFGYEFFETRVLNTKKEI